MLYTIFYIILTLFTIFERANSSFNRQSSTKCNVKHNKLMDVSETYAEQDLCNFTLAAPKMIINPYKLGIQNLVHQKSFGSFFLKCAACLAVAEQVRVHYT